MAYKNHIKNRLKELGRSQEWLAERTGIRRDYLSKIINGHFKPNIYDGLTIAIQLGKPAEDLFAFPLPEEENKDERTT